MKKAQGSYIYIYIYLYIYIYCFCDSLVTLPHCKMNTVLNCIWTYCVLPKDLNVNLAKVFFSFSFPHGAGPEDRVLYMANDTEIRSFVHPFNQSHGHKLLTHIEDNARIIGMDALFHHQKFIWATQFNPGGIFYKDTLERGQTKTHVTNIVSIPIFFNFSLSFCSIFCISAVFSLHRFKKA